MEESGKNRGNDLRDALLLFVAATVMAIIVVQLKSISLFVKANASVIVALGFILFTTLTIRWRKEDGYYYGLNPDHWKSEVLLVLILCAVIFPVYIVGFEIYWNPPSAFRFHLREPLWSLVLTHFLVVALPEEYLFRGFIQQRLGAVFKKRIKIFRLTFGWHIPAAAALFALGHFVTDFNPNRLATFFPALVFGTIKERRGSLLGCILFHALCNIFSDIVVWGYYPQ